MTKVYGFGDVIDTSPDIKRRRAMSEALLGQAGKAEPVYGWGHALSKVLAGAAAAYNLKKTDEAETAQRNQGLAEILGNTAAGQWKNPDTGEMVGATKEQNQQSILKNSANPITQNYRLSQMMNSSMPTTSSNRAAKSTAVSPKAGNNMAGGSEPSAGDIDTGVPTPSELRGETKINSIKSDVAKAIGLMEKNKQFVTSGPYAQVAKNIYGTDAATLDDLMKGYQSDTVLSTLGDMKMQSRTGASGLGQVTEKEIDLLQNALITYSPSMNYETKLAKLKLIQSTYDKIEKLQKLDAELSARGVTLEQSGIDLDSYLKGGDRAVSAGKRPATSGRAPQLTPEIDQDEVMSMPPPIGGMPKSIAFPTLQLPQMKINKLKAKGFTDEQIQEYLNGGF